MRHAARTTAAAAFLLPVLLAGSALAAPGARSWSPLERGEFGLRLGLGKPGGEAWGGVDQSNLTAGLLRVQGELGYRFGPSFSAGLYGALGYGSNSDQADGSCEGIGVSCSVRMLDVGLQSELRLLPNEPLHPWLGASLGLDVLLREIDYGSVVDGVHLFGPALALFAGLDLTFERLNVGPYVGYQAGWYLWIDAVNVVDERTNEAIDNVTLHGWLLIGVRARYTLGSDGSEW